MFLSATSMLLVVLVKLTLLCNTVVSSDSISILLVSILSCLTYGLMDPMEQQTTRPTRPDTIPPRT